MGDEIPEDFVAPDVCPEGSFAYSAFGDLGSDRHAGFGVGPIPWSAIDAYAARYGISEIDEFDSFVWMIRTMDAVLVDHHQQKQKRENR